MLVVGFPAGPLQANCYLIASGEGQPCVVVDPGQDAVEALDGQLRKHQLSPAGVLLTHGHFDHVFSAAEVSHTYGVPVWIHPDDEFMLADPGAALGPQGRQLLGEMLTMNAPSDVRTLDGGADLELAGIRIEVIHSPGHTAGSMLFGVATDEGGRLLLTGDTLFAGAIGRTDLPGGDHQRMLTTLRTKLLTQDDATVVLPGHGPTTTIGRERAGNPFLQDLGETERDASSAP